MEYRFSFTARLAAFGVFAAVALLALVFALGFILGLRAAGPGTAAVVAAASPAVAAQVPAPRAEAAAP